MADTCDSVQLFRGAVNNPVPFLFQCKKPINPHMRRIVDHRQTFIVSENWPGERIEADPTLMADAGFYYLGDSDRVKCRYCNGDLKNWERYDDPWMEHAKWFPLCDDLLKNKGVDFVKAVVKDFPGLNRPAISNPSPDKTLQG